MKPSDLNKLIKSIAFTVAICCLPLGFSAFKIDGTASSWGRNNELGYPAKGIKVAVWVTKDNSVPARYQLIDVKTGNVAFAARTGKLYGSNGAFKQVLRLNLSAVKTPGAYYI